MLKIETRINLFGEQKILRQRNVVNVCLIKLIIRARIFKLISGNSRNVTLMPAEIFEYLFARNLTA